MPDSTEQHSIPPGVDGQNRGFLVMTVDEILWLRDVGMSDAADVKYHLRAGWWGSKADTQVVFVPVDVRNFVQNGLIMHSYPVKTGEEKLKQYLNDASPLILSLFMDYNKEAVGRAYIILDSADIEGYFPILDNVGEEIAAVHVKILFVDSLKQKEEDRPKSPIKPRPKPNRVTFPVNVVQQSLDLPTADTEEPSKRKNSKGQMSNKKSEENLSFLSSTSNVSEVSLFNKSVLKSNTLSVTLPQFSLKPGIFDKIRQNYSKQRKGYATSHPKVFVYAKISFPGRKDVTFCTRLDDSNQVRFIEAKMIEDFSTDNIENVRKLTHSNVKIVVGCRIMGCKDSIGIGTASMPLRNILFDDDNDKRISVNIKPDRSLLPYLGYKSTEIRNQIGNLTLNILKNQSNHEFDLKKEDTDEKKEDLNVTFESPLPPKLPPKKPLYQIPSKSVSTRVVQSPVCMFLDVMCKDRDVASWAYIRLKWWTGEQSCGFGHLQCSQTILKPDQEPEARFYNRQSLSQLLDNYLVLELWRHDQIVGIARVPTHALHCVAQSWTGHTVTCFDELVQIVSVTSGNVLGYFNVRVTVGHQDDTEGSRSNNMAANANTIVSTDAETDVDDLPQDNEDDDSRHYHTPDDFLNSISVNEKEDEVEVNPNSAVVIVEEVRFTSFSSWVYCSFPNGKSSKVFKATETKWNVSVDVDTGAVCSDGSQSHLIIRLWSAAQGFPDFRKDKMRGFISVDCSPLLLGFPLISGWYNIIDWMGKSKGQVKITMQLKNPIFKPPAETFSLTTQTTPDFGQQPFPTNFTASSFDNKDTDQKLSSLNVKFDHHQSPSISTIESKLSQNLKDLNLMTTKLVADCDNACKDEGPSKCEQNISIHPCDLTFGLIDEYLKMTTLVTPAEIDGQMTDRSRIGPEGGNAD